MYLRASAPLTVQVLAQSFKLPAPSVETIRNITEVTAPLKA